MSFQSRWSHYCVLDSSDCVEDMDEGETTVLGDRDEEMEVDTSMSSKDIKELAIFGQFYKLEQLAESFFSR